MNIQRTIAGAIAGLIFAAVPVCGINAEDTGGPDEVSPPNVNEAGDHPVWMGVFGMLDGDTLSHVDLGTGKITRIRLWAVAAPEMSDWPAGPFARAAADAALVLTGQTGLVCEQVDTDRHDRPVAVCYHHSRAGILDWKTKKRYPTLNAMIVATGHAVVHRLYFSEIWKPGPAQARLVALAKGMLEAEQDAIDAGRGIWRTFDLK